MLQVHVSQSSTVADHCRSYALSTPDDDDYILKCDHTHNDKCDRCSILPDVVNELYSTVENMESCVKDEMKYAIEQAEAKINAWKAHLLRSINQDQARLGHEMSPKKIS